MTIHGPLDFTLGRGSTGQYSNVLSTCFEPHRVGPPAAAAPVRALRTRLGSADASRRSLAAPDHPWFWGIFSIQRTLLGAILLHQVYTCLDGPRPCAIHVNPPVKNRVWRHPPVWPLADELWCNWHPVIGRSTVPLTTGVKVEFF